MQEATLRWKTIVDYPFPHIDPYMTGEDIKNQAIIISHEISTMNPDAVLCQGEMRMTFTLVHFFQIKGIPVYVACSNRIAKEEKTADESVEKISVFQFERFGKYPLLDMET